MRQNIFFMYRPHAYKWRLHCEAQLSSSKLTPALLLLCRYIYIFGSDLRYAGCRHFALRGLQLTKELNLRFVTYCSRWKKLHVKFGNSLMHVIVEMKYIPKNLCKLLFEVMVRFVCTYSFTCTFSSFLLVY